MSTVSVSSAEAKIGAEYAAGCSGFIADLLGKPQKAANNYTLGAEVTSSTPAGTVVGWHAQPNGHVAVKTSSGYIDCPGLGKKVRSLTSYGDRTLYKMTY